MKFNEIIDFTVRGEMPDIEKVRDNCHSQAFGKIDEELIDRAHYDKSEKRNVNYMRKTIKWLAPVATCFVIAAIALVILFNTQQSNEENVAYEAPTPTQSKYNLGDYSEYTIPEGYSLCSVSVRHDDFDYIYYSNPADGCKLYKMKDDGTENIKLSDKIPFDLKVIGDYVYFSGGLHDGSCFSEFGIYKAPINAEAEQPNSEVEQSDAESKQPDIEPKQSGVDAEQPGSDTKQQDIEAEQPSDGGSQTPDNEPALPTEPTTDIEYEICIYSLQTSGEGCVAFDEKNIYFTEYESIFLYTDEDGINVYGQQTYICKIDLNGNNKTRVANTQAEMINSLFASGSYIYYVAQDPSNTQNFYVYSIMYRIRNNGTDKTKLSDENLNVFEAAVIDDWVYLNGLSGASGGGLFKMRLDGTDLTQLIYTGDYGFSSKPLINRGWIYYLNDKALAKRPENNTVYLCRVRTDGSDKQVLGEVKVEVDPVQDDGSWGYSLPQIKGVILDWVYYSKDGYGSITGIKINGEKAETEQPSENAPANYKQ